MWRTLSRLRVAFSSGALATLPRRLVPADEPLDDVGVSLGHRPLAHPDEDGSADAGGVQPGEHIRAAHVGQGERQQDEIVLLEHGKLEGEPAGRRGVAG